MSYAIIRSLLQSALEAVDDQFPTGWENSNFKPTSGQPHQFVYLKKSQTLNPTQGPHYQREMGIMQVALYFPAGQGSTDIEAKAQAIKNAFQRGTSLTQGTLRVLIDRSPYDVSGPTKDGWYQLLVYVPYIGDVYQ